MGVGPDLNFCQGSMGPATESQADFCIGSAVRLAPSWILTAAPTEQAIGCEMTIRYFPLLVLFKNLSLLKICSFFPGVKSTNGRMELGTPTPPTPPLYARGFWWGQVGRRSHGTTHRQGDPGGGGQPVRASEEAAAGASGIVRVTRSHQLSIVP